MNAIAMNEEVGEAFCKKVLSVLLQRKIGKIKIVAQYTLPAQNPKYRGIRMDVMVEEFGDESETQLSNVYDLYCTPIKLAVNPDCRPPARYFYRLLYCKSWRSAV